MFLIAGAMTNNWADWLHRSLALLVLACPCSIVIAAPIPCVVAIAEAAKRGVLIKGSSVIEKMGEINMIGIDKTGTLTSGFFRVCERYFRFFHFY